MYFNKINKYFLFFLQNKTKTKQKKFEVIENTKENYHEIEQKIYEWLDKEGVFMQEAQFIKPLSRCKSTFKLESKLFLKRKNKSGDH